MKRRFSIRTWMIGGIIAMVVVSYLGSFAMAGLSEYLSSNPPQAARTARSRQQLEQIFQSVAGDAARWTDPAWQADVTRRLSAEMLGLELIGPDGSVLFRMPVQYQLTGSGKWVSFSLGEMMVYAGGRYAGRVVLTDYRVLSGPPNDWEGAVYNLTWVGIGLVVLGTVWLFVSLASRAVLKPLAAVSQAAARVNEGSLDFDVPSSAVAELDEFGQAFARMRDGLRESLGRQAELEQERRMFVAAVAHDLRTPLTSVRGYLEGIRDGVARTPDMLERYVRVALEKTGALERLVDGLFNYSRTEYLSQPLQAEPLELGALLSAAAAGLQPQAAAKGVRLALDAGPEPAPVSGDAAMLGRVVDNLLDNALRHTPSGGQVTVGWRRGLDAAVFWVQDSGPGIPPEDIERIFQPLYRADKARGSRTGGAGLGLAIARRLVEAHGGSIQAENRDGARFSVHLPLGGRES